MQSSFSKHEGSSLESGRSGIVCVHALSESAKGDLAVMLLQLQVRVVPTRGEDILRVRAAWPPLAPFISLRRVKMETAEVNDQ